LKTPLEACKREVGLWKRWPPLQVGEMQGSKVNETKTYSIETTSTDLRVCPAGVIVYNNRHEENVV
jgi:hypothetical protein